MRTLEYYGQPSLHMPDVGVAGLWRLIERIDELDDVQKVAANFEIADELMSELEATL